jgi:hypothetical protein
LVDLGASSNVIPFFNICNKINTTPKKCSTWIIQIDKSNAKFIREIKYLLIKVPYNQMLYQIIDIIVVDIPEYYGLFLAGIGLRNCKDIFHKLFSTMVTIKWIIKPSLY